MFRKIGFSVDASVHIPAGSAKTREVLVQYIAWTPLFLKKISIEESGEVTVLSSLPATNSSKERSNASL
jgi:hypothetical protein